LDIKHQSISSGELQSREIGLTAMRIGVILLLEDAVLFLFGYRSRHSWLVFLMVNAITLCYLNAILIHTTQPRSLSSSVIFGGMIVFIIEMIAFPFAIKENSRWITAAYVLVANILKLLVGIWLVTKLPF